MFEPVDSQEDLQFYYTKNEDFSKLERIPLTIWAEHFRLSNRERNKSLKKLLDNEFIKMKNLYCFLEETQVLGKVLYKFGIPHVCGKVSRRLLLPYSKSKAKHYGSEKAIKHPYIPIAKKINFKAKTNIKANKPHRYPKIAERWSDVAIRKFKSNNESNQHTLQSYTFDDEECKIIDVQFNNPVIKSIKDYSRSDQEKHTNNQKSKGIPHELENQPDISENTNAKNVECRFGKESNNNQLLVNSPVKLTNEAKKIKEIEDFVPKPNELQDKIKKYVRFNDSELCTFAPTQVSIESFSDAQESDPNISKSIQMRNNGNTEIKLNMPITKGQILECLQTYVPSPEHETSTEGTNDKNVRTPHYPKVRDGNIQFEIEPYCLDSLIIDESSFSSISDASKHISKLKEIAPDLEKSCVDVSNGKEKIMKIDMHNGKEVINAKTVACSEELNVSSKVLEKEHVLKIHEDFTELESYSQNNLNNTLDVSRSPSDTTTKPLSVITNSTINLEKHIINYSLETTNHEEEYYSDEFIPQSPPNRRIYLGIETLIELGGLNIENKNSSDLNNHEQMNEKQCKIQDPITDYDSNKILDLSPGLSDRDYVSVSSEIDDEVQLETHENSFVEPNVVTSISKINIVNNENLPTTDQSQLEAERDLPTIENMNSNKAKDENITPNQCNVLNNHIKSVISTETILPYILGTNSDTIHTNASKTMFGKTDNSSGETINEEKSLGCLKQLEVTPATNETQEEDNNADKTKAPLKNIIRICDIPPLLEIGQREGNEDQNVFHKNDLKTRRALFSTQNQSFLEIESESNYPKADRNLISQNKKNIKAIKPYKGTENNLENAIISSVSKDLLNVVSESKIKNLGTLEESVQLDQYNDENKCRYIDSCKPYKTTKCKSSLNMGYSNEVLNDKGDSFHPGILDQQENPTVDYSENLANNISEAPLSQNVSAPFLSKEVSLKSQQILDCKLIATNITNLQIHEIEEPHRQNIDLLSRQELITNNSDLHVSECLKTVKCDPIKVKINNLSPKIPEEEFLLSKELRLERQQLLDSKLINKTNEIAENNQRNIEILLQQDLKQAQDSVPYKMLNNRGTNVREDLKTVKCDPIKVHGSLPFEVPAEELSYPILSKKFTNNAQINEMKITCFNSFPSSENKIDSSLHSTGETVMSDLSQIDKLNRNEQTFKTNDVTLENIALTNFKKKKEVLSDQHSGTKHANNISGIKNCLHTKQKTNLGKSIKSKTAAQVSDCAIVGFEKFQEDNPSNISVEGQMELAVKFAACNEGLTISNPDRSKFKKTDVNKKGNHERGTVISNSFRVNTRAQSSSSVRKTIPKSARTSNMKVFSSSRRSKEAPKMVISSNKLNSPIKKFSRVKSDHISFRRTKKLREVDQENNQSLLNTRGNFGERRNQSLSNTAKHYNLANNELKSYLYPRKKIGSTTEKIKNSYPRKEKKPNKNDGSVKNKINITSAAENRYTNNQMNFNFNTENRQLTFDHLFTKSQTTNCSLDYVRGVEEKQPVDDLDIEQNSYYKNENSSAMKSMSNNESLSHNEDSSQDSFYTKYNRLVFNEDSSCSNTSKADSSLVTNNNLCWVKYYFKQKEKYDQIKGKSESTHLENFQKRKFTSNQLKGFNGSPWSNYSHNEELSNKRQKIRNEENSLSVDNLSFKPLSPEIEHSNENESYLNGKLNYSDYSPSENEQNTSMKRDSKTYMNLIAQSKKNIKAIKLSKGTENNLENVKPSTESKGLLNVVRECKNNNLSTLKWSGQLDQYKRQKMGNEENALSVDNLSFEPVSSEIDQSNENESYSNGKLNYSDFELDSPCENEQITLMERDSLNYSDSEPYGSSYTSLNKLFDAAQEEFDDLFDQ